MSWRQVLLWPQQTPDGVTTVHQVIEKQCYDSLKNQGNSYSFHKYLFFHALYKVCCDATEDKMDIIPYYTKFITWANIKLRCNLKNQYWIWWLLSRRSNNFGGGREGNWDKDKFFCVWMCVRNHSTEIVTFCSHQFVFYFCKDEVGYAEVIITFKISGINTTKFISQSCFMSIWHESSAPHIQGPSWQRLYHLELRTLHLRSLKQGILE